VCIMEVRAGQRSSTIAQACAHNAATVERDIDMFIGLLEARGERDKATALHRAQAHLRRAYADLLMLFTAFVAAEEEHVHVLRDHHPGDDQPVGGERRPDQETLVAAAHHDAQLARRHETR
jgi:hypothetical protein